jgi:hypothetical protein
MDQVRRPDRLLEFSRVVEGVERFSMDVYKDRNGCGCLMRHGILWMISLGLVEDDDYSQEWAEVLLRSYFGLSEEHSDNLFFVPNAPWSIYDLTSDFYTRERAADACRLMAAGDVDPWITIYHRARSGKFSRVWKNFKSRIFPGT